LYEFASPDGMATVGVLTLAANLDVGHHVVRSGMRELERVGLLVATERPGDTYRFQMLLIEAADPFAHTQGSQAPTSTPPLHMALRLSEYEQVTGNRNPVSAEAPGRGTGAAGVEVSAAAWRGAVGVAMVGGDPPDGVERLAELLAALADRHGSIDNLPASDQAMRDGAALGGGALARARGWLIERGYLVQRSHGRPYRAATWALTVPARPRDGEGWDDEHWDDDPDQAEVERLARLARRYQAYDGEAAP
jgi:hypothetical protein